MSDFKNMNLLYYSKFFPKIQTGKSSLPTGKRHFVGGTPAGTFVASKLNTRYTTTSKKIPHDMKNTSSIFAATLILFFGLNVSLNAQKTATWKGGFPGKTTEWTCAANWNEGSVPDEFSDVVIPDVSTAGGFQPVIRYTAGGVNSLTLLPGAQLHIEVSGSLEVFESFEIIANGSVQNKGQLNLPNVETTRTAFGMNLMAGH